MNFVLLDKKSIMINLTTYNVIATLIKQFNCFDFVSFYNALLNVDSSQEMGTHRTGEETGDTKFDKKVHLHEK